MPELIQREYPKWDRWPRACAVLALLLGVFASAFSFGIQAQTITNTASVTYQVGPTSAAIIQNSNSVSVNATPPASPATVTFYQYAPGAATTNFLADRGGYSGDINDLNGTTFTPLPQPTSIYGQSLDTSQPLPVRETAVYHAGEPVIFTLTDANRNTDSTVREFVNVTLTNPLTGDSEVLRLQETGPNTGVFAGVIQSMNPKQPVVDNDGRISVDINTALQVDYTDPTDPADVVQDNALVDPFGILFDSVTGAPVGGGTITIINADTGQPAQVFGDDGVSSYPPTLTFGGGAVDSSGTVYTFPTGGYRFPFVMPGNYFYVITPPASHTTPSTICTQAAPAACPVEPGTGLPYAIGPGSHGDVFVVLPGPALNIDIPADPPASALQDLFLLKTVSQAEASAGDFLQYRLSLRDTGGAGATTVVITDTLPPGMRYQSGSLRIGAATVADPVISTDGRTLTIPVGAMAANVSVQISYVVQVVAQQATRESINRARAAADGGLFSNTALATVRIRAPLMSGAFTIIGRVLENCATPESPGPAPSTPGGRGVPNARILLDDGTYVATDRDGLFHFEGVRPGTHVVQLDLDSLAPDLQVVPRIQNSRFAGRAYSQFVDVRGGGLWRTDFHVCPSGNAQVGLKLRTTRGLPGGSAPDAVREYTVRAQFDSAQDTLKDEGGRDLNGLIKKLKGADIERIEVIGHTDDQRLSARAAARFKDNYGLSEARARAVGSYLAQGLGLQPEQVTAIGRGPDQPEVSNATAAGRAKNRRTEINVYKREKSTERVFRPDALLHRVEVDGGGVPVKNLRVTVLLPEGATYVSGSARLDGASLADPRIDGETATFGLGDVGANWKRTIEFETALPPKPVTPDAPKQYTVRAQFDSCRATLKPEGEQELNTLAGKLKGIDIERLDLSGHTDNQRPSASCRKLFQDNYGLSQARAATVGKYLAQALGLSAEQVRASGKGPDAPVASNTEATGMARNRRTEVIVYPRKPIEAVAADKCSEAGDAVKALATFDSDQKKNLRTPAVENVIPCLDRSVPISSSDAATVTSRREAVSVKGALVKETPDDIAARTNKRKSILSDVEAAGGGDTDWLAKAGPGIGWLYPTPEQSPRAPATRVVIAHGPGQKVELAINGQPVHPLNYDGSKTNAGNTVAVSLWRGVPLLDGGNSLVATVTNADGSVAETLKRTVFYSNAVARAELVPGESVLVADGIHPPVIAVRMLDREGKPVRAGVSGGYQINSPFTPRQTVDELQQRQLAGMDRFQPTYRVEGDNGIAYIELQPTTESGEAVLSFTFQNHNTNQTGRRQELRSWIAAAPRDWLVVGFAEGTVGYNTLKDNLAALPAGTEEGGYNDGQVSLYAKGAILGKWLMTMAYDSDKPDELERRRGLLSTIDPNQFYTLYGDGAQQRYDAASQDKLYLKIERAQFYALFGDYDTGLTVTQLSRYSRTLNGIKSEFGGGPVTYSAFASETAQNFARDEIRGDGTSGLYRLTRRELILNSEKIRIETRGRYQSEQIIATRFLTRHIDYDIDYANGTLFFREPINSRDADFNPIFIVAEYETFGAGQKELSAGGRVGFNLLGDKLKFGVSAVREETFTGESDLTGVDLKVRVDETTEIRVEGATSEGRAATIQREGDAYLAELEHHGEKLDALVYSRKQDPGFGLNQQNGSESGVEKLGTDLQFNLSQNFSLAGQVYRQENLASDATRDVGNARLQYRDERNTLSAGYQIATDETLGGQEFESQQATVGASRWFWDRKLELSANGDVGLNDKNANADFPSRYQVGAAYAITPDARLFVAQEITDGDAFDTSMTRAGLQATPWQGARLNTTLNQGGITEYGPRTFGQMGLSQSLLIGKQWGVDFSVDSSRTFKESGQPAFIFNPNQPSTVTGGTLTDDFVALSGGLTYRSELWSWNGRAETRNGSNSERHGVTTGFLRQAQAGIAFSANAQAFQTALSTGSEGRYGNLSLAWAWRPLGYRWSIIDRLEFKYDELDQGTGVGLTGGELFGHTTLNVAGDATTRRVINNLAINRVSDEWTEEDRKGNFFTLQQRNQWSLYYGAKYASDNFDGVAYSGYTDLLGLEWRYDLTRHWDLGLQASSLNSWKSGTHEYSAGPQIGWSPVTNGWLSLGYNLLGFTDRDFDAAKYTAQGPYLKLRFKFDQNTRLFGPDKKDPRAMEWDEYAKSAGPAQTTPVSAAPSASAGDNKSSSRTPAAAPSASASDNNSSSRTPAAAPSASASDNNSFSMTSAARPAPIASAAAAPLQSPAMLPSTDDDPVAGLATALPPKTGAVPGGSPPTAAESRGTLLAPLSAGGRYAVSLVSLRTATDAEAYAMRIRAAGYPTVIKQEVDVNGLRWYRVLIPGFDHAAEARQFASMLREKFPGAEPWVVPLDRAVTQSASTQVFKGPWSLSLASLTTAEDADRYAARVKAAGYPVVVHSVMVYGARWYRVAVPGFSRVAQASAAVPELQAKFPGTDPWVLPAENLEAAIQPGQPP